MPPHLSALPFNCALVLFLILSLFALVSPASAQPSYTPLFNDNPVPFSLAVNNTAYFTFTSPAVAYQQTALLSIAALTGFPSMFISLTNPAPSASSFDYSASYSTGGVVSITAQPPWTAYIAVVASPYSSSNFTVVATTYDPSVAQTALIPLTDVRPLSSALAAGEYRYYSYSLHSNVSALTIANTLTRGPTVILVNGPGLSALPTLTSSQWSSLQSPLSLVNVYNASSGSYLIGVWSNVSCVFSLTAAASTSIQPIEFGVTYPGVVRPWQYRVYSFDLDPALLPTSGFLSIALVSLTFDADLLCSNVTSSPALDAYRWASFQISSLDFISITTAQLSSGTIYCSVLGWGSTPQYTLTVGFGTPTLLSFDSPVEGETLAPGQMLYSYAFEGNVTSLLQTYLTVSTVSEFGATTLWMEPYGTLPSASVSRWSAPTSAALQVVQVPVSSVCGVNFANAIPGTSPLLCQLNVLVATTQATAYRISISGAGAVVPLISGQSLEGIATATQSSSFSFSVPDDLSNLTLLVNVLNEATDITLTIGRASYEGAGLGSAIWTVAQQAGQSVIPFTMDWNDPRLPFPNRPQGDYVVIVSSQQNATFLLSYTLTNITGNGGTITPLIDGLPQVAQVSPGQYGFFFFGNLPLAGWPYSITFNVEWSVGFGVMSIAVGDGTTVGPLVRGVGILQQTTSSLLLVNPNSTTCTPTTLMSSGLPCGYSLSILVNPSVSGAAQFTVTATTGKWVREVSASSGKSGEGAVQPGDGDYWVVRRYSGQVPSVVLLLVTVTSGRVAVFASNSTIGPNSTQAQWSLPSVESAALLDFPVIPPSTGMYSSFYFTVACLGSSLCQYSLLATTSYPSSPQYSYSVLSNGVTTTSALSAGVLTSYYFTLSSFTSVAFLTLQVIPLLGTPSVYAQCVSSRSFGLVPVDELYYTWSAVGPGPLLLEITDLPTNFSRTGCTYLMVGLRAAGGVSTAYDISATTAGVAQDITYQGRTSGLITPAYPSSYFRFNLMSADLTALLSFTLTASTPSCQSSLQLLVSPSVVYPTADVPGVTYTFIGSPMSLDDATVIQSVSITNSTQPVGSLRSGMYYLAVINTAPATTCQFTVQGADSDRVLLQAGQPSFQPLTPSSPATFFFALQANTAVSFGVSLQANQGVVWLYVGINTEPLPSDSSTFVSVQRCDSSLPGRPSPIFLPSSTCTVGVCDIVILAVTTASTQQLALTTAVSTATTWLPASQPYAVLNASTTAYTRYQFTVPSSTPQSVTVSVQSPTPVDVACSYQYVTPDRSFYDWATNSSASPFTANQTVALTFSWTGLQLNPSTALASPASTCYCTVLPRDDSQPFTIAFTSTALSSPPSSSSSGLSSGALAAAIVVPVLCAVAVLGVVWWVCGRGGGCSRWMEGMKRKGDGGASDGGGWVGSHSRLEEERGRDMGAVPMAELQRGNKAITKGGGGESMLNQHGGYSDMS